MDNDEKIRKSYNGYKKMYRYVRINKKDGSFRNEMYKSKDINEYTSLYDSNIYNLEYKPYKPYWFFCLVFAFSYMKEKNKDKISIFKKSFNSWWIRGIVIALTLYIIKIIFKIDL